MSYRQRLGAASLSAERRSDAETGRAYELRGAYFLAVFTSRPEHFDDTALCGDIEARLGDGRHFAHFARDLRKAVKWAFARVEDLQLLAVQRRPRPRRGIAAPNQVVDEVDMMCPMNARLGFPAPPLVAFLRFILHDFPVLAGENEIGGFEHRFHAHREELVEIDVPDRLIGT